MHFNLADLFETVAQAVPDNEAVISGDTRLTFAQLDRRANRVANRLKKCGVRAGDHVGLHLYNCAEFIEALIGTIKIRAVPININYRYVAEELHYLFDNADLVALVHQRAFAPMIEEIRGRLPKLKTLIAVDDHTDASLARIGSMQYEPALAQSSEVADFSERSGDDLYVIYTGGTTGMPRGVMWRHEDVFFAGLQGGNPGDAPIETPEQIGEVAASGDKLMRILPAAPFIHGAAQWSAFIGLFTGGKVVIQPGPSYDPKIAWRLIRDEDVTVVNVVGDAMATPLADAMAAEPQQMENLMCIASAGAILSDSVKARLAELQPDTMVLNNFGASETGHQGSIYPGMEDPSGRLTFYMDESNAVFDDDGERIEPGSEKIGRLARTGRIPVGYYNDPEKTAKTFVELEGKRWVMPGDLATVREDGFVTVFGRGAVCINSGGEKVFPEEVEEAVKDHPDVADALIVGIPDDRWGQRVVALVEAKAGSSLDFEAIDGHCRKKVAGYKCPRAIFFVEHVERQPSGKPDYTWAKATALERSGVGE